MPPILSPAQIEQIEKERDKQQSVIDTLTESQSNIAARVAELQLVDSAFKDLFDYYNEDIIGQYDAERKALDGNYIASSIVELDIIKCSELDNTGRITPIPPATDAIRIAEFDGTPLINTGFDKNNEIYWMQRQGELEGYLVSGLGGTSPTTTPTLASTTPITLVSTSISFTVTNPIEVPVISVGNRFVLVNGAEQAAIEITSAITTPPGGYCTGETPPLSGIDQPTCVLNGGVWTPVAWTGTFDFIFLTKGNVSSGASIDATWAGFTNADRIAKIDSTNGYNALMNQMIDDLEEAVNGRLTMLTTQETSLNANQDADKDVSILTQISSSKTFLNNYLISTDISNTSISLLASERGTRNTQANNRVSAITTAYTGQTENYYNMRYTHANNRGNTVRGTLRQVKFEQSVSTTMDDQITQAQELIDTYNDILP